MAVSAVFLPFLGSCSRACRGVFRRTFVRLVSGFWLAAASLLLPPRLHTRLSFWQNARLLTTDGENLGWPPARAGWSNGPEKRRRQRAQGGWGRKTAAGRVGRRRQPHLRRGALALSRPALELTLRALPGTTDSSPKGSQRFALALSLGARCSRPSASSFYADITARKTNVVYNNNFSAVSRLLLPCLPRGIPPHFRAARIRVLAGCRQLATTAASAHSLVFWQNARLLTTDGENLGWPPARAGWSNGPEKRRRQRATHHFRPPVALMASLSEDVQTGHWTPEPFG